MSIEQKPNNEQNINTQQNTQEGENNEQNMTNQQFVYPPGMLPGYPMGPGMMQGYPPGMMPGMMPGMNPGMMPGMNPGMMGYGPQAFAYINDPMEELEQCNGAIIRQELEMYEIISGCETENRYHVFLQSNKGLKYAFKCIERSGCCSRCCCSNDCRALKLDIKHVKSANDDPDLVKSFISARKPCALACCCLCRPILELRLSDDNNTYLGKIREPCTCCDINMDIYDENKYLKYNIIGNCCQYGLCCCCGASAEKLTEIQFKIMSKGEKVGMMRKLASSKAEFYSKADSYKISFPPDATPKDKMLLICAGLLVDYQNFEKNSTPQTNRKKRRR